MKMKYVLAGLAALAAVDYTALAQEEEISAEAAGLIPVEAKRETKWFYTIPLCRRIEVGGEVQLPGQSNWTPVEEGRFYPLGSSFRAVPQGTLMIALGNECSVTVADGASFETRQQVLGVPSRTIVPKGGELVVSLPSGITPGAFVVAMKDLAATNLAGESNFVYRDKGDGFEVDIRCVTGTLDIEGRHYKILGMHAADGLTVRSSHDGLATILYGRSGNYVAKLDRGIVAREEIQDDGSVKVVTGAETLDWNLSVGTRVQINRAVPAIGKRMSVSMLTFSATGELKNHFAFAEGRSEVNTGELVHRPGEVEEISKKAAEVTTEAATDLPPEQPAAETTEVAPEDAVTAEEDDDF